jgi:hypothetical protein
MMAAFAELERDIIHKRTTAGLAAARAQGRNGGRPTVMDADKLAAARARRERGESSTQIASALGISRASAYRRRRYLAVMLIVVFSLPVWPCASIRLESSPAPITELYQHYPLTGYMDPSHVAGLEPRLLRQSLPESNRRR